MTLLVQVGTETRPMTEDEAAMVFQIPPVYVPQSVSMRQAELELYDSGLLDDVEALVATLPRAYQIEWKRASTVDRSNPLVEIVRDQQGLTSEDIDNLFIRAAAR